MNTITITPSTTIGFQLLVKKLRAYGIQHKANFTTMEVTALEKDFMEIV